MVISSATCAATAPNQLKLLQAIVLPGIGVAAAQAGVSPEVVHFEDGIMVTRFVEARSLTDDDLRDFQRIVADRRPPVD